MKKRVFLVEIFTIFIFCCVFLNAAVKKRVTVGTNLNETSWKLTEIRKNGRSSYISRNTNITINFSKNKINGSGGINGYSGNYKINRNSTLSATVTSTLMGGPTDLMNLEQDFFDILQSNPVIKHNKDTLTLVNNAGDIWTFKNPNAVNQRDKDSLSLSGLKRKLLNTSWKLIDISDKNMRKILTTNEIRITLNFSEDRIHGDSGVNNYFSNYVMTSDNIVVGPIGSTKMAGPDNFMKLESQYLNILQNSKKIKLNNNRLTFTTDDGKILTFKEM